MGPKWAPLILVVLIFLFLFDLPSGFKVNIVAGRSREASKVDVSGSERHVITDEERTLFKIGDHDLKQKVGAYFGKVPKDAYVRGPTPWGDLYKRYSWPQVEVSVKPVKAEILSLDRQLIALKTQEFVNQSPVAGTFTVSVQDSVWNTVSSSWTRQQTISFGQKISYGIEALGTGVTGETSLGFEAAFGQGGSSEQRISVGSSISLQVDLKPGEKAMAQLKSYRSVMKVRVYYHAQLWGSVAVNYYPKYKGHHFWSLDINKVMGGDPGKLREYSEIIEVGYYSDSKTELLPHKMQTLCKNGAGSTKCGKMGLRKMLGSSGSSSTFGRRKGEKEQKKVDKKRQKRNRGRKNRKGGMSKKRRSGGKKTRKGKKKQRQTNNKRGKRNRVRKNQKSGKSKKRRSGGKKTRKGKKKQRQTNNKRGKRNRVRKNKKSGKSKKRKAGGKKGRKSRKNRKGNKRN